MWLCWLPCVFKSCLLSSMSSGLLVIPGVSTLPCLTLMSSLKTIILKYILVCVFLVSPCCVHRDNSALVQMLSTFISAKHTHTHTVRWERTKSIVVELQDCQGYFIHLNIRWSDYFLFNTDDASVFFKESTMLAIITLAWWIVMSTTDTSAVAAPSKIVLEKFYVYCPTKFTPLNTPHIFTCCTGFFNSSLKTHCYLCIANFRSCMQWERDLIKELSWWLSFDVCSVSALWF